MMPALQSTTAAAAAAPTRALAEEVRESTLSDLQHLLLVVLGFIQHPYILNGEVRLGGAFKYVSSATLPSRCLFLPTQTSVVACSWSSSETPACCI